MTYYTRDVVAKNLQNGHTKGAYCGSDTQSAIFLFNHERKTGSRGIRMTVLSKSVIECLLPKSQKGLILIEHA